MFKQESDKPEICDVEMGELQLTLSTQETEKHNIKTTALATCLGILSFCEHKKLGKFIVLAHFDSVSFCPEATFSETKKNDIDAILVMIEYIMQLNEQLSIRSKCDISDINITNSFIFGAQESELNKNFVTSLKRLKLSRQEQIQENFKLNNVENFFKKKNITEGIEKFQAKILDKVSQCISKTDFIISNLGKESPEDKPGFFVNLTAQIIKDNYKITADYKITIAGYNTELPLFSYQIDLGNKKILEQNFLEGLKVSLISFDKLDEKEKILHYVEEAHMNAKGAYNELKEYKLYQSQEESKQSGASFFKSEGGKKRTIESVDKSPKSEELEIEKPVMKKK